MADKREGLLIVMSGPSGVGKGAICRGLISGNPNMKISISVTTRSPRPGETDGQHYLFKTQEEFERMIEADEFLEYMHVFGANYYGTPKKQVFDALEKGCDVLLEIDVQGAIKVKQNYPKAVCIFIAPPSMQILKSRLTGRGTEDSAAIERRFSVAYDEIKLMDKYDYIVVNDVLETAISQIQAIIAAENCRTQRNIDFIDKLKEDRLS